MLTNYLIIAFRSLLKRRLFSFVNLFGLVLGLVTFLVLVAFVATEFSYNEFHTRQNDLYRVVVTEGNGNYETYLPPGYASIIENNFDQVESVNRLAEGIASGLIAVPGTDLAFTEEQINFVEGSFFDAFSFPIKRGEADLSAPNTAVLTFSMAQKLFGDQDPLGEIFVLSNQFGKAEFTVTGVLEAIPDRSDLGGEVFVSIHTLENPDYRGGNGWADPNGLESGFVNLYLLAKNGVNPQELSNQMTDFIRRNPGSEETEISLQPIDEMHLGKSISDPLPSFAEMGSVLVFLAIAILILGIAYVNYLNLSSASILTRIKEVKMRKVLGAQSWQLAQQFMTETLVLLSLAALISGLLIYLLGSLVNQIFGQAIWLGALFQPEVILLISGIILACALISGIYVVALSGSFDKKSKLIFKPESQLLRKSLVVFQFVISVGIIICTLVIQDQLSFMQNQNLGMNVNQKLAIAGPNDGGEDKGSKMIAFKESLRSKSYVKGLAGSNNLPGIGYNFSAAGITPLVPRPEDKDYNYSMFIIDEQFLPVFEIELVAGRNFTVQETSAGWNSISKVIINEKAAKQLGFEDSESASGQNILWGTNSYEILGVVKDYHHMSLREEIKPMIFLGNQADGFITLTMESTNMKENLAQLQDLYREFFPGNPFNYSFIDEVFARQYQQEVQLSLAFSIAGILAIVISCLGLFALAAYEVQQRTKEIGIRKVLGASSQSLIKLISTDFMILVVLGIIVAIPVSWYFMNGWLSEFPYKPELSASSFVAAGLVSLLVALATVGVQAIRAAWANPVESIRNE